jgi:hypothetical protein
VSILAGESHQIDLVLPSAAPLNILVDPTVIAINKVLRGRGAAELPPAPYEFARAAGMSALASDVSLAGHNIVDGDVIALIPAGTAERYGPVVENVSTALAQYASEHFVRVSAQTALAVAAVIIGGALGVASLLLWRLRWAHESAPLVPILFAAATICLVATVAIGARLGAGRVVIDGAAWAALFTPEGLYQARDATPEGGGSYVQGRENLARFCCDAPFDGIHFLHLPQISVDGDSAVSRVHLEFVCAFLDREAPTIRMVGYYDVSYERVDGRWLIARRVTTTFSQQNSTTFGYPATSAIPEV